MFHGKFSVGIKIGIIFIFNFHRRPIQLYVSVPVGLSSFLYLRSFFDTKKIKRQCFKLQRSTVQAGRQKKLRHLKSAEDVRTTKGLQERTRIIDWNDGET